MDQTLSRETLARRAVLGVGILGAHVGLVLLLAAGGFVAPTLVQSVSVSFLQQEEVRPEKPRYAEPTLQRVQHVVVPEPEVVVPIETPDAVMSTSEVHPEPAPAAPTAAAPSSGSAVPEMSEVAYVVQPSPRYPAESRRTHEQGLVVLRVLIDEGGHARSIEVYRSSGHPRLDEAARAAVARAVFRPFMDGGVARAAAAIVPIEFSLRSSAS